MTEQQAEIEKLRNQIREMSLEGRRLNWNLRKARTEIESLKDQQRVRVDRVDYPTGNGSRQMG